MSMIHFLCDVERISAFILYVPLFFLALSAYKRTKQNGFIFLGFAAIVGVLNSPMPFQHSGVSGHSSNAALYSTLFYILGIVKNVFLVAGFVMIAEGYCQLFTSKVVPPKAPSDSDEAKV